MLQFHCLGFIITVGMVYWREKKEMLYETMSCWAGCKINLCILWPKSLVMFKCYQPLFFFFDRWVTACFIAFDCWMVMKFVPWFRYSPSCKQTEVMFSLLLHFEAWHHQQQSIRGIVGNVWSEHGMMLPTYFELKQVTSQRNCSSNFTMSLN